MSGCDYCEAVADTMCAHCDAQCCRHCSVEVKDGPGHLDGVIDLCNPDRNTYPQGGCYRPPISEVTL